MTANELLTPRYEVVNTYPNCDKVGDFQGVVLVLDQKDRDGQAFVKRGSSTLYEAYFDAYPNIYRKLSWWEKRSVLDMPKKIKTQMFEEDNVYEIEQWDMGRLFGYVSVRDRSGCGLTGFKKGYGYLPVD
jgi:hypothetical protein